MAHHLPEADWLSSFSSPSASPERLATRLPHVAKHCGQVAGRSKVMNNKIPEIL